VQLADGEGALDFDVGGVVRPVLEEEGAEGFVGVPDGVGVGLVMVGGLLGLVVVGREGVGLGLGLGFGGWLGVVWVWVWVVGAAYAGPG
jgi:hypothetical protein